MPRFDLKSRRGARGLSGLIDESDSDTHFRGDVDSMLTSDSELENLRTVKKKGIVNPTKQARARGEDIREKEERQRKRIKMEKLEYVMSSPAKEEGREAERKDRRALNDRTNRKDRSPSEERFVEGTFQESVLSMDELDASIISFPRPQKVQTTKSKFQEKLAQARAKKGPKVDQVREADVEETPKPVKRERKREVLVEEETLRHIVSTKESVAQRERVAAAVEKTKAQRKRRRGKEDEEPMREIAETQQVEVNEEEFEETEAIGEEAQEPTPPKPVARKTIGHKPEATLPATRVPRQTSAQPRHIRAGSFDAEGRSDPATRRKLPDLQNKLDAMDAKYHNLRELAVIEAERKFDELRKQSEKSAAAAKSLVASLQEQLTAQERKLGASSALNKTIQERDTETSRLKQQLVKSEAETKAAKEENRKNVEKVASMRSAAASIESVNVPKVPGSAQKPAGGVRIMGTAEQAQAAQAAQLKIDLYSDLTGLIIRSLKRETEEDVFDCIQTGRNGSKFNNRRFFQ